MQALISSRKGFYLNFTLTQILLDLNGCIMKLFPIQLTVSLSLFFIILQPAHGEDFNKDVFSPRPFLNSTDYVSQDEGVSGDTWFHPGDSKHYSGIRRKMLRAHQVTGLLTWGLWLATNLAGEKALDSLKPETDLPAMFYLAQDPTNNLPMYGALKYNNPSLLLLSNDQAYINRMLPMYYLITDNAEWESENGSQHKSLAAATIGMYALTASLGLFSPPRFEETHTEGVDSIFLHKGLALVHLAAMLSMGPLGEQIEHGGPSAARKMQNAGWGGFTALSAAIVVVYF